MDKKLFDSELKLMEFIWSREPISAKELSMIAAKQIGWNKNTTYTVIKKLVEKEIIKRSEPGFICTSLVKKEEVQKSETSNLIERLYQGSKRAFFASFLEDDNLTEEDYNELKALIERGSMR
jgi:predicted transcriptional regulator